MAVASIDIKSGRARICAFGPAGLAEVSCQSVVHVGSEGCHVGSRVDRQILYDQSSQWNEFDLSHLAEPMSAPSDSVHIHTRPQLLFALLAAHLRKEMSNKSGLDVTQLILPEPAGAIGAYRKNAAIGAELAGLRISSVIKEAVAASHFHLLQSRVVQKPEVVLVIQFGSDALSVSLLRQQNSSFQVLSEQVDKSSRDPVRQVLTRLVSLEAGRKYPQIDHELVKNDISRIANRLGREFEIRKSNQIKISDWLQDYPIEINLHRQHLCQLVGPSIRNGLQAADACLTHAHSSWDNVDVVILLGELANWPNTVQEICRHSGKPASTVISRNSDRAVAVGAAMMGAGSHFDDAKSAPFGIGIHVADWQETAGANEHFFFEPGTKLPVTSGVQLFTRSPAQKSMFVQLIRKDRAGKVDVVGGISLTLPPGVRRGYPIWVSLTQRPTQQITLTIKDEILGTIEEHHVDPLNLFHPTIEDRHSLIQFLSDS